MTGMTKELDDDKRGFCTCMLVCTCAGGSCRFAEEVVVVIVVWSKWPDST
jgi:hypothetical protein